MARENQHFLSTEAAQLKDHRAPAMLIVSSPGGQNIKGTGVVVEQTCNKRDNQSDALTMEVFVSHKTEV